MASGTNSQVDNGIDTIDLDFLGVHGVIASYLIDCGDQLTLVETGPTTTLAALTAGIERQAPPGPTSAPLSSPTSTSTTRARPGMILRDHPHLDVLVHPVGAPHLVAPERLVRCAGRIYGDDMERLWGEIAGVPEAQRADSF